MKHEPLFYLEIMLEYCNRAISYIADVTLEQFINDKEKQDSISHVLYRMAEASVQLDEQFKNNCIEINWKDIHGLRVLLAHIYHNVDFSLLHTISVDKMPMLKVTLEQVIDKIRSHKF